MKMRKKEKHYGRKGISTTTKLEVYSEKLV